MQQNGCIRRVTVVLHKRYEHPCRRSRSHGTAGAQSPDKAKDVGRTAAPPPRTAAHRNCRAASAPACRRQVRSRRDVQRGAAPCARDAQGGRRPSPKGMSATARTCSSPTPAKPVGRPRHRRTTPRRHGDDQSGTTTGMRHMTRSPHPVRPTFATPLAARARHKQGDDGICRCNAPLCAIGVSPPPCDRCRPQARRIPAPETAIRWSFSQRGVKGHVGMHAQGNTAAQGKAPASSGFGDTWPREAVKALLRPRHRSPPRQAL